MKSPNLVILFTDDQRFDTIAALGNPAVKTPNMDRLVAAGTSCTHAHIPGGIHPAVCMPSRAMLHTGRTLFHLQDAGKEIPESHRLLGELLKSQGYQTWATGKWHNGKSSFNRAFQDGDEIMFGGMADHWNVPVHHYDPEGKYASRLPEVKDTWSSNELTFRDADHINNGVHSSELFADAAVDWLQNYRSENPYFMYISFMAPHDPRTMPDRFKKMYPEDSIELPENFLNQHSFEYGVREVRDELLANYPREESEIQRHIAEYYGMISHLDDEIGKILDAVESRGEWEDTLFVFAGDNGLALGQHGLMGKQSAYDHSVRVPLIFSGPGIPKNKKTDVLCYLLDVFPTLCDLLKIDIPESVEGKSLANVICNRESKHRESLYFAYHNLIRAVRKGDYKWIHYKYQDAHRYQLFDLKKDPLERNNLANSESASAVIEDLKRELLYYKDTWEDLDHPSSVEFWG